MTDLSAKPTLDGENASMTLDELTGAMTKTAESRLCRIIATMTLDTLTGAMTKTVENWLGRIDLVSTIKVIPGEIVKVYDGVGGLGVICDLFVRSRGDYALPPKVRGLSILVRGADYGGLGEIYDIDVHAPTVTEIADVTFDDALDAKGVVEHEVEYGPMSGLVVYRAVRSPMYTVMDLHDALKANGLRHVSTRDLEDGRTAVEFAHPGGPDIAGLTALCGHNAKLPLDVLRAAGWRAA